MNDICTHCATSVWLLSQAACKGDPFQAVSTLGSAPCSRRDLTSSRYPRQQAQYRAVPSFLAVCELRQVSFLCASNFLASVTLPLRIASISDIAISSSALFLSCNNYNDEQAFAFYIYLVGGARAAVIRRAIDQSSESRSQVIESVRS